MAKIKRWTEEEDKILVQAIIANPHNKTQAIKEVLPKLNNRTLSAASYRWYCVLSNPESKKYVGCLFTMIGHYSRFDNRTINTNKSHIKPVKSTKTIWSRIKKFLGLK